MNTCTPQGEALAFFIIEIVCYMLHYILLGQVSCNHIAGNYINSGVAVYMRLVPPEEYCTW